MGNKLRRASKKKEQEHPLSHLWKETGMYPNIQWTKKDLKTMVLNGNIAPLISGCDDPIPNERILSECPICFMYYSECAVNVASCCSKPMCSQCYCSVQVSPDAKPACCPFCTSPQFNVAPMVKGVQFPERYGLDATSFRKTIQMIRSQGNAADNVQVGMSRPPSNSISVEQRQEQQERMADLSDLAEVERVTSPSIAPYHLSPGSQPGATPGGIPSMSLGGGGSARMNSVEREAWQRSQLEDIFGENGPRISQSNSNVRMAIEQMMMEEAIRLSLNDGGGGEGGGAGEGGSGSGSSGSSLDGSGNTGEGKEETSESVSRRDARVEAEVRVQQLQEEEEEDADLAAAIRASLEEAAAVEAQRQQHQGGSKAEEEFDDDIDTDDLFDTSDDDNEENLAEEAGSNSIATDIACRMMEDDTGSVETDIVAAALITQELIGEQIVLHTEEEHALAFHIMEFHSSLLLIEQEENSEMEEVEEVEEVEEKDNTEQNNLLPEE